MRLEAKKNERGKKNGEDVTATCRFYNRKKGAGGGEKS